MLVPRFVILYPVADYSSSVISSGITHQSAGSDSRSVCQSQKVLKAIIIGTSPFLGNGISVLQHLLVVHAKSL